MFILPLLEHSSRIEFCERNSERLSENSKKKKKERDKNLVTSVSLKTWIALGMCFSAPSKCIEYYVYFRLSIITGYYFCLYASMKKGFHGAQLILHIACSLIVCFTHVILLDPQPRNCLML